MTGVGYTSEVVRFGMKCGLSARTRTCMRARTGYTMAHRVTSTRARGMEDLRALLRRSLTTVSLKNERFGRVHTPLFYNGVMEEHR